MFKKENGSIDYGFSAIVLLIGAIAVWLVLTPLVPGVAMSSMHRFHIRSSSFGWWAAQAPVPSMYNFCNSYRASHIPEGLIDPLFEEDEEEEFRIVNHFPTRVITFADGRYRYMRKGTDCWFTIKTSYRGQTLVSKFHTKPNEDGEGTTLIRQWLMEENDER